MKLATHLLLALLLCIGVALALLAPELEAPLLAQLEAYRHTLEQPQHWPLLLAAASTLSALGLPRQVIAYLAGAWLGGTWGAAAATAAAVAGCSLDFLLARHLARPWLRARYPRPLARLDALLRDAPFLKALALRLFPSGSNWLTSLLGGASSVRFAPFVLGSSLGYAPQMLLFAYLGSGSAWALQHGDRLTLVLLALALGLGLLLFARHRRAAASPSAGA